ncbi:MAG: glycine betaine ABC transporter substrate-binding protein [Bacteroidota bacterium]
MSRKALIKYSVSIFALLLLAVSCTTKPADEEDRTLRIVYTDWSESIAITHLSAVLLEEEMDYKVILKLTDVESAYQNVASGEYDVFADAWLPETHQQYINAHEGKIEELGITYPEARTGLVVPEYSKFKSITDLKNYPHSIVGIDEGAGVMQKTHLAIENYALPNTLLNLSEEEMVQHLEDSVKRRNEVVVTGWEPHWIFARFEVRFLEDPDNIFGEKEKIYSVGRKGLNEAHPHAVRFFERMQLSEKQLNSLVYHVRLTDDPVIGVKNWIDENEYIVNQWVKNLKPERKKIM